MKTNPPHPPNTAALTPDQRNLWQGLLQDLNQHNILCHCRQCDREWVSSEPQPCVCGSSAIEWFSCWQFPDD